MRKKTLVLGASLNEDRYSNLVIHRLKKSGMQVVAFGLKEGTVADVQVDTLLEPYEHIDTVTLYLNPKHQTSYYNYIIGLAPKRVIFNPGTENLEFQELLTANGIAYENACTLVLLGTNQF